MAGLKKNKEKRLKKKPDDDIERTLLSLTISEIALHSNPEDVSSKMVAQIFRMLKANCSATQMLDVAKRWGLHFQEQIPKDPRGQDLQKTLIEDLNTWILGFNFDVWGKKQEDAIEKKAYLEIKNNTWLGKIP